MYKLTTANDAAQLGTIEKKKKKKTPPGMQCNIPMMGIEDAGDKGGWGQIAGSVWPLVGSMAITGPGGQPSPKMGPSKGELCQRARFVRRAVTNETSLTRPICTI